jgi:hypothetical protein
MVSHPLPCKKIDLLNNFLPFGPEYPGEQKQLWSSWEPGKLRVRGGHGMHADMLVPAVLLKYVFDGQFRHWSTLDAPVMF